VYLQEVCRAHSALLDALVVITAARIDAAHHPAPAGGGQADSWNMAHITFQRRLRSALSPLYACGSGSLNPGGQQ
jgi:hypothetical protein